MCNQQILEANIIKLLASFLSSFLLINKHRLIPSMPDSRNTKMKWPIIFPHGTLWSRRNRKRLHSVQENIPASWQGYKLKSDLKTIKPGFIPLGKLKNLSSSLCKKKIDWNHQHHPPTYRKYRIPESHLTVTKSHHH